MALDTSADIVKWIETQIYQDDIFIGVDSLTIRRTIVSRDVILVIIDAFPFVVNFAYLAV